MRQVNAAVTPGRIHRNKLSGPGFIRAIGQVMLAGRMSTLGASARDRTKLFAVTVMIPFLAKPGRLGRRRFVLWLTDGRSTFPCAISDPAEIEVLREIFLDREYDLRLASEPNVILDLGSNFGASILFFHGRYPHARIVGVEPDPTTFAATKRNVGHLPRVCLLNVAVAGREDRMTFRSSGESAFSSLTKFADAKPRPDALTVPTMTIDAIMLHSQIDVVDLMKIDIEGAEFEAIQAFSGLARVNAIIGEFHAGRNGRTMPEFLALLDGFEVTADEMAFQAIREPALLDG